MNQILEAKRTKKKKNAMSYPSEIIGKFWVDRLPKLDFGQAIKFQISEWIRKVAGP